MPKFLLRALVASAVVASGVACSSGNSDDGLTLRIGATSVTGTPAGSLGWGDREGILAEKLKAAGVDKIEYSFFQSGSDAVSALIAGAVDVAAVGDNPALTARGRNADVELLAFDQVNQDIQIIGAKGGPTDLKGLVGKTITAPQGTIRDRTARQLIAAAGLTGQIEVRDVPTPESIAGLNSGSIDATVVSGSSAAELEERGFPILDSLSRHGFGATGLNISLKSFTEKHPEFRAAWQDAVTSVNKDIAENFPAFLQWVAETDDTKLAHVEKSYSVREFNTEPIPAVGVEQLQAAYEFLLEDGRVETPFSVTEWAEQSS